MHTLLAILIFTAAIALMAIGVVFKRKAIRGSCGGTAKIDLDGDCACRVEDPKIAKASQQSREPKKD